MHRPPLTSSNDAFRMTKPSQIYQTEVTGQTFYKTKSDAMYAQSELQMAKTHFNSKPFDHRP